jgi:hypothetical protein
MADQLTVTVSIDGGLAPFPGLSKPFTVDAAELSPTDADELAKLVAESGFFELPDSPPAGSTGWGGPDARTYTVAVTTGDRVRELTLTDPLPNTALRALVNFVEARRRAC